MVKILAFSIFIFILNTKVVKSNVIGLHNVESSVLKYIFYDI
jgi:hypothetical protein